MRQSWFSLLLTIVLFWVVIVLERVVGVPLISLVMMYHHTVGKSVLTKVVLTLLFVTVQASLFMINPVVSALLFVGAVSILESVSQDSKTPAADRRHLYISLLHSGVLVYLAHAQIHFSFVFFFIFQIIATMAYIRKVIFRGLSQSFHWEQDQVSSKLHEKKV